MGRELRKKGGRREGEGGRKGGRREEEGGRGGGREGKRKRGKEGGWRMRGRVEEREEGMEEKRGACIIQLYME